MIAQQKQVTNAEIFKRTFLGGVIGCLFLALIYLGLTKAAACNSASLEGVPLDELMTHLANITLGLRIGVVANVAVALACLTTVVSLITTISNILCKEIFRGQFSYHGSILGMLIITWIVTNFGFGMIMKIIHPTVSVCYPFIIVLTIVNIYLKLKGKPSTA